jgi:hypothetical protein
MCPDSDEVLLGVHDAMAPPELESGHVRVPVECRSMRRARYNKAEAQDAFEPKGGNDAVRTTMQ